MKTYAGIGARKTPIEVLNVMTAIATFLAKQGYTLRSGYAKGADQAFEQGTTAKEIYFTGTANEKAKQLASTIHPAWNKCSDFAKEAHARNMNILLGKDLNSPVDFVLCWTEGAKIVGGTATGLKLAQKHGIPIINLAEGIEISKMRLSRLLGLKCYKYGASDVDTGIPRMGLPELKKYLRANPKKYYELELKCLNLRIDDIYLAMVLNEGLTMKTNIHYENCDVYCGRGSPFGNKNTVAEHGHGKAIELFKLDFEKAISKPEVQKRVMKLKGKRLGCFCSPRDCHCDVLINWIDQQDSDI